MPPQRETICTKAVGTVRSRDDVVAADGCASKAAFVRFVRQELRRALCQGNTRVYDRSLISVASGVEMVVMSELERAMDGAGFRSGCSQVFFPFA